MTAKKKIFITRLIIIIITIFIIIIVALALAPGRWARGR